MGRGRLPAGQPRPLVANWPTDHSERMQVKRVVYHMRELDPVWVKDEKFNREREMARRVRQRLPFFCYLSGEPHDGKSFCEVCDCGAFEANPLNYVPS